MAEKRKTKGQRTERKKRKCFDFYKRCNYPSMGMSKRFNRIQCKEDFRKTELTIKNEEPRTPKVAKKKQATQSCNKVGIRFLSLDLRGQERVRGSSQSAEVNQTKSSQSRGLYLAKLFFTDEETQDFTRQAKADEVSYPQLSLKKC